MTSLRQRWKHTPASIRKPAVMIAGSLFILAAGLTGWLPGPGGIPLFLIGIAILATEFSWAKRLQAVVLGWVHRGGSLFRQHKILGSLVVVAGICLAIGLSYIGYHSFKK